MQPANRRPTLFISHCSEDQDIAAYFEDFVNRSLQGRYNLFRSTNEDSLAPGTQWFAEILESIRVASAVVVIATPASINRPWVNWECGAAWAKGTPLIPCCALGMNFGSLPATMGQAQSVALNDPSDLRKLTKRLAELSEIDAPTNFDYDEYATIFELARSQPVSQQERSAVSDHLLDAADLLVKLVSREYSLSSCLVWCLKFAVTHGDTTLENFCQHELNGYPPAYADERLGKVPQHRFIQTFVSRGRVNTSHPQWGGNADVVFSYMATHPDEFTMYKSLKLEGVPALEAKVVSPTDISHALLISEARLSEMTGLQADQDTTVFAYAHPRIYESLIQGIRQELISLVNRHLTSL